MGYPLGFAPEAALEDLGLPLWGPGMEVVQLLGCQGFWQHQVLRGVGVWGSRKYSALEGYGNQYWPIRSSMFAWRTPSLTEKPGRPQSTGSQRIGHYRSDPVRLDARFLSCGSSAPVRVEHDGGAAAWLVGTLAAPSVQGHGLPLPQELWSWAFFPASCSWWSEGLFGQSFSP